jgi:transcription elongation GreA/GreB family factor
MNERTQTPQRVERLREELNRLIHDQLPLAIESIQGACQSPDFSGSLAYAHSAQRRWFGESRIAELKNKLVKSEMTGAGNGHEISRVVFGAVVTLRMEPQGETVR